MKKVIIYFLGVCSIFVACGSEKGNTESSNERLYFPQQEQNAPKVKFFVLQRGDFAEEILSEGHLKAKIRADVKWEASEEIKEIRIINGDYVQEGEILACLDSCYVSLNLQQSKDAMAKATLDLQDLLIGQGYMLQDSLQIPKHVMEIAMLRSGYRQTRTSLDIAFANKKKMTLHSPISGFVTNLNGKPHQQAKSGEIFCTIINRREMEITFPLMEDEVKHIERGGHITLDKGITDSLKINAQIHSINPVVEDNGLIMVTAIAQNIPEHWLEGTKVNVKVKNIITNELVVPKSAVVTRDGKAVIFSIKGGKAFWNYVETGRENSTHYTIIKGIEAGDSIIHEGNEQLAHLSLIVL